MGKGTILGGGKDGLYLLNVDYGDVRRQQIISEIDKRLATLATSIGSATAALATEEAKVAAAQSAVDSALNALEQALQTNPTGDHAALYADVKAKTDAYQAAIVAKNPFQVALNNLNSEKASLETRRNQVASLKLISSFPAWCADFTENATGQVATIEVPGEPRTVLIAPGAPAPTPANGTVQARELMTPEQVFVNAALLPGWQKFKPTFRAGVITRISGNTCSVNLIDAESSANNLKINQTTSLSNVPIKYMDCDGAAFSKGDVVLVRFDSQNWKQPKVVGFISNPKQCVGLQFNGAVYRQIIYYSGAVWSGNTDPNYSGSGFYFFQGSEQPVTSWPGGNGPQNTTFFVSSIYFNTEFLILVPQDVDKLIFDQRASAVYTVNGKQLNRNLSVEDFGYCEFEIDDYSMTDRGPSWPDYLYNRFQVSTYIGDQDPTVYAIEPCKKVISYVYIHEEYWPGNSDGGSVIGTAPNASYGVSASQAIAIANSAAHANYQLSLEVNSKTIFSGTLATTVQTGKPPGQGSLADGYVCLYDGTYKPSIPWTWSGGGIKIPPEVTWIQEI